MSFRYRTFFTLLLLLLLAASAFAADQNPLRLKPGAKGKICQGCHLDFEDKLKKPFLHTPVKAGECTGCHNPHASEHSKLLAAGPGEVCRQCHDSVIPEKARSVHQVVASGECGRCHDPHGADNPNNLVKKGNELCAGCHAELNEKLSKQKNPHSPVADGCLNCHDPHGSAQAEHLLSAAPPALCRKCHQTGDKKFAAIHMNYPVADADCTTCHDPHGSNQAAILYDTVHQPVAKRMCNQCHQSPDSAKPLAIKKEGVDLCRGCHSGMVNEMLGKNRMHWPLLAKDGCMSCHLPHASPSASLLAGSQIKVCGKCHDDTIQRQERSKTKHEPIAKGNCGACHNPHGADNALLLKQQSIVDLCATCHDWQKHSTHPLGEKVVDPRNPNSTVQCLSCHRSHGTEFEHMIPFATISNLCVQCHEQYKR